MIYKFIIYKIRLRIKIYIYSNNSRFFYKINNSLNELRIPFYVLNYGIKLRNIKGIILTTQKEFDGISSENLKNRFLIYQDTQDFEEYIMHVLAAHKFNFKKRYFELIFSIDPGKNKSGIAIFLDEYFLISKILHNQREFVDYIGKFISYFNSDKLKPIIIKIFFGIGVPSLVESLLEVLSRKFIEFMPIFYLVDERNTSKMKYDKHIFKISKHEISAIWIAIRGIKAIKSMNILNSNKEDSQSEFPKKLNSEIKFDINLAKNVYFGNSSITEALNFKQ